MKQVPSGTHMCLIYSNRDSAKADVFDFLRQAIADDGQAHYFANGSGPDEVIAGVARGDIARDRALSQMQISNITDVYLAGGRFEKDRMLALLAETYRDSKTAFPGPCHFTGEMDWATNQDDECLEDLVAYEREVNHVCAEHPFSAICQYDATRFEPEFLYQIVQAHPFLLIDGMIIPNPDARGF